MAGGLRKPATVSGNDAPPKATAVVKGEACPMLGSWQVAQDMAPEADKLGSEKINCPS